MTLSSDEIAALKLYTIDTYGINLDRGVAKSLEAKGLVQWLPPSQWSGTIYGLTKAGWVELDKLRGNE